MHPLSELPGWSNFEHKCLASSTDCILVQLGNMQNFYRSYTCAIGKYQDEEGQTSCKLCSAGTYTTEEGETSCTPVAAGKYANASGSAIACPIGQYQDEVGQTSCKLCSAGNYNSQEGQISCEHHVKLVNILSLVLHFV